MDPQALYTKFPDADRKICYVETKTFSNSAFGVTPEGESVFLGSRLIETLRLEEGERVLCYVVPNYPDKQVRCQLRAIRAERIEEDSHPCEMEDDPPAPKAGIAAIPREAPSKVQSQILEAIEEHGFITTKDLAELLDMDSTFVSNHCRTLHRTGIIYRADVFRLLSQRKASLVVWAISPDEFSLAE